MTFGTYIEDVDLGGDDAFEREVFLGRDVREFELRDRGGLFNRRGSLAGLSLAHVCRVSVAYRAGMAR